MGRDEIRSSSVSAKLNTILGIALLAAAVLSLFVGSRFISATDVAHVLIGKATDPTSDVGHIVWELRLLRTILAVLAGASLALAGALCQVWTRNPLADPGIIGITAGASFAVAVGVVAGLAPSISSKAGWAIAGAALGALVIIAIAKLSADPLSLVLVGFGVAAALHAATTLLSLYSSSNLDSMRQWTVGSTVGRAAPEIQLAAIGLAVGAALAVAIARPLDLLAMGTETARSLGISPRRIEAAVAAAVIVLAGTATAAVGPVAFVGFAVPHIVRRFTGPALTKLLLPTAMTGGLLVLTADIVGRLLLRPGEIEMSIVLVFIGAPLMIYVVRQGSRSASVLDSRGAVQ